MIGKEITVFRLANSSQGTRLRRSRVVRFLANYDVTYVLECGCGVGTYSKILHRIAGFLYSFDINIKLVNISHMYVKRVKFFVADVQDIPFVDCTFNTVIATDIIEHLRMPERAIKNFYNVLKSRGVLLVTVPSKTWNIVYKLLDMKKEDVGHYHLYDIKELKSIFEKEGFRLIKYKKIQSFFSAFIDVLVAKLSIAIFGNNKVLRSEMTLETANNILLAIFYYIFNIFVYPVIIFFEWILPDYCKAEYLIIFKKE